MSYDSVESSHEGGRPIEGIKFTLGSANWRYVSASEDFTDGSGNVWKAIPISHDGVKQTGEAVADALQITAPFHIAPVQFHTTTPPSSPIQVTIHRQHVGDAEMVITYSGEIRQVNFPQPGKAVITCETHSASMKREGLRLGWQRSCPYAVYDPLTCKVNKASHAVTLRVLSVDQFEIVTDDADSFADDHFSGGFCTWEHPVRGLEYRGVEAHTGNTLRIFGTTDDMYEGMVLTAYPGCPRSAEACDVKFNNLPEYGGFDHMPGKSPFDGSPVF